MSSTATLVESPVATRQDVSRLFARAAFGATAEDLDTWAGRPYAEVVDSLLNVPALDGRTPTSDEAERILMENNEEIVRGLDLGVITLTNGVEQAGRWWLERMRTTQYPLEERMTLFWHDHFATAYLFPYPDVRMLIKQNQTLRRHALGSFRAMVEALTVDEAMLYWLNGNENAKGAPNENYARELLELFTLGVIPQIYTEQDIREAARALTGWTVSLGLGGFQPSFNAARHDTGQKSVLGTTFGNLGDQEYKKVIDIALAQTASPKFVAYKMVLSFAYLPPTGDLFQDPDPLVDKVAATLRATNWNLKEAMRTLLMADEFRFADASKSRQVIRQPIDLVASLCKQIGVTAKTREVSELLRRMAQLPFDPPNVGGWPRNKEWLSPVTTLARYDWGVTCYNLFSSIRINDDPNTNSLAVDLPASSDVDGWIRRFGLADLSANTRSLITDYLASRPGANLENERQAGVLILIASSPDWMVM
ncbi:MAG: DUF1800 domain-containing protein [Actinomycetota bacterium]